MRKNSGNILLIVLAAIAVAASVGGYFWWQNKTANENKPLTWEECIKIPGAIQEMTYPGRCVTPDGRSAIQPLTDEEKKKLLPPNETVNWKTYATKSFSFKYPPDWKVGTFEHFPDIYTLQPNSTFIPESMAIETGIIISRTDHCLNTQCLTVFSLEEMVKQMSAKILAQTTVDNLKAYKITESGKDIAYVFIHGPDFVQIRTEGYPAQLDQIVSTFKFLDQSTTGETLIIDFSTCQTERKRIDVAFGSTTYEITGKKLNVCEINYGGEVENPNWNGKLDTNCQVPITMGKIEFGKNNYGVDFSPIKNYCSTKNN